MAARKLSEYDKLKGAVLGVLQTLRWEPDYHYNQQYGGKFDGIERTFVGFNTGKSLRRLDRTKAQLKKAKAALDTDGRFGSVVHYMKGAGDYTLIVQFGPDPIL